jgi:hypothetical protein
MIVRIPKEQLCQAFDPMMTILAKTEQMRLEPMTENTSCLCPAYVYIEGIHGKRFLCDFHFVFEQDIVMERTPDNWPQICEYLIEELEDIKQTFAKDPGTPSQILNKQCFNEKCELSAYVSCIIKGGREELFCNFHYRKKYYRYLSNKIDLLKEHTVIDERYRMPYSIKEEILLLTYI